MSTSKPGFIVIDNLAVAIAAIDRLIDAADEIDIPGLRRAAEKISEIKSSAPDPRIQWALQVLKDEKISAQTDKIAAVRALRSRASGLGVLEAGIIVKELIELDTVK